MPDEEELPNLNTIVLNAKSDKPEIRFRAIQQARRLTTIDQIPPIDQLIQSGILRILVQCLEFNENSTLQYEAAWALTNIAAGTSLETQEVVNAGALPLLIELLHSPHQDVCEQTIWTLGNIIGDGPELRDQAISLGVVTPLLALLTPETPMLILCHVSWVLENMCRNKTPTLSRETVKEILPPVCTIIQHMTEKKDNEFTINSTLTQIINALSGLSDQGEEQIQILLDFGVIKCVLPLLTHSEFPVKAAALRTIGNILTGTDEQTQAVLNCDALSYFPALLTNPTKKLNKEALWCLSNIIAGNRRQVQSVIDANMIPFIIKFLRCDHFSSQNEAAWAVRNLTTNGNRNQVAYMVKQGVIPPFCALLTTDDDQIIQVVLFGLDNILRMAGKQLKSICDDIEECGGLNNIKALIPTHIEDAILILCYDILQYMNVRNNNI